MTEENKLSEVDQASADIEEALFGKKEEDSIPEDFDKSIDEVHTIAGGNDSEEGEEVEEDIVDEDSQESDDPTPEETAQDKLKFVQTSYQKHLELLKQHDPQLYNEIQTKVKAERGKKVEDSTDDEYDEDPYSKQIAKGFEELRRQQHAQLNAEKYIQEYNAANNALEGFVKENGVTQDDLNMAFKSAAEMGFDIQTANENYQIGMPNRTVKYVMEKLQSKLLQDYYSGKREKLANEKAQKTEAIKNVTQPNSGATPSPRKLTKEEIMLNAMKNAGKKEVIDDFFKTTK